ncbi:protein ABIL2 [Sesamum angolense]|uniref:Protein ABIL2 n=1 Tax=Sesamum angolense TaxID=2727404 RepID=A0AAE2BWI7_9LAMI|nr:protein ABIL2 [Sesamum angolense]
MDLKNLRKQLYTAAEYFESSYGKNDHKQLVIESSKDYVAKALVSTVDHLGSVADKLNRFLDEKAKEFSATKIRFSCMEQVLRLFSLLKQSLCTEIASRVPSMTCTKPRKCSVRLDNPFAKAFQPTRVKSTPPLSRKGQSRISSSESSPNSPNFSFTRVTSNKEARLTIHLDLCLSIPTLLTLGDCRSAIETRHCIIPPSWLQGMRSVSPLRFPLMRSGSVANRSVSPSPSDNKQRSPSEPQRAISVFTRPGMTNREREIQSYSIRNDSGMIDGPWTRIRVKLIAGRLRFVQATFLVVGLKKLNPFSGLNNSEAT